MRLGGPVFVSELTPERWVTAVKAAGYGAAYCPIGADADSATIRAYEKAAQEANIVIAGGAWSTR